MKLSNKTLYRFCNEYQWFTSGDCTQYEKLFEKNKVRALKRLQRLSGFARSDTKKKTF